VGLTVAENFKKRERISLLLRISFNRGHKGVEGTNDRARAHPCGWFNAGFAVNCRAIFPALPAMRRPLPARIRFGIARRAAQQ